MDSAKTMKHNTRECIYNIGKNKKKISKMCNEIKCAIQYTVDLINNNINRDVQEECAYRLYRVCLFGAFLFGLFLRKYCYIIISD